MAGVSATMVPYRESTSSCNTATCRFNAPRSKAFPYDQVQLIDVQRFHEKIKGSALHDFHGPFNRPMGRHHNDRRKLREARLLLPGQLFQHFEARHPRHFQIKQNESGFLRFQEIERVLARRRRTASHSPMTSNDPSALTRRLDHHQPRECFSASATQRMSVLASNPRGNRVSVRVSFQRFFFHVETAGGDSRPTPSEILIYIIMIGL